MFVNGGIWLPCSVGARPGIMFGGNSAGRGPCIREGTSAVIIVVAVVEEEVVISVVRPPSAPTDDNGSPKDA